MRKRVRSVTAIVGATSTVALLSLVALAGPDNTITVQQQVRPVLLRRCVACHGGKTATAGLNLLAFPDEKSIRAQSGVWRRIVDRIEKGEMPPPGSPALTATEKKTVLTGIRTVLTGVALAPDPGPPLLRRLTRNEYDRTIHDLLGLPFDSGEAVGMMDDRPTSGYDTLASAQNLSPAQMEKYEAAADQILDRIVANAKGELREIGDWPMQEAAHKAHDALFTPRPDDKTPPRTCAQTILTRLLPQAFRRPVPETEAAKYLALWDRATAKGEPFEEAMRPALKAILLSTYFLFRVEADLSAAHPVPVSDNELATRLSYFLWSSMPDTELRAVAAQGRLSDPTMLEKQVRRMLADSRARALTESFGAQWLQLRKLATARPSQDVFPSFTASLRTAMADEVTLFFDSLRTGDTSVYRLLDADYTYVNEELAKHYGLSGITGEKMKRVSLKPTDHRGGLLGMAAVHTLTSHTFRTSPTLRGKYVLEVVFGTPPPPPPPGVSQIAGEKDGKSPETFREQLARHASQPSCAGCHRKMDPLGFALDNYDAIGRWRTLQGDKPLDTTGSLPDGTRFTGADDLRHYVAGRKTAFLNNAVRQMLTYGLGRPLEETDAPTIARITEKVAADDGRFSTLVLEVARSYPFRYRRPAHPQSTGIRQVSQVSKGETR